MTGDELLKRLAEAAGGAMAPDSMPAGAVRFTLEYHVPPDLAAERARVAELLGSQAFLLEPMDEDRSVRLGRFLVLQFPGVARHFSDRALYEMGNALAGRLDLISCEPDVGARIYGEPDARGLDLSRPEGVVVDLWCKSNAPAPAEIRWALSAIRAPQAWEVSPAKGSGILVGQPDTGVAAHPELESDAIAWDKARNILEGGTDPRDPLSSSMANPGHGTATASVVVSRDDKGVLAGSAPGARLAPIRCVNDVKIFDGAPVAAAINHARKVGCDVVTMSLGGFPSSAIGAAVADAVDAGLIVLAAAGNCVKIVVYPAFDDRVIAVAGVDAQDRPWKGTSKGAQVDISAPAENVFVARRAPNDGGAPHIEGGQGTSYAVALTAGVAATWLAHHGRGAVRAEAARRGVSVQALFLSALRQTARRPAGWDRAAMGAGVVDAEALLKLRLRDITGAFAPMAARAEAGDVEQIWRLALARANVDGFDWARHGAEAAALAAKAHLVSRRSAAGMETLGFGGLRASTEVAATAPAILRKLLARAPDLSPSADVAASAGEVEQLLRIVGKSSGGGVESAAAVTVEAARRRLRGGHADKILDKLATALGALPSETEALADERKRVVTDAQSGLRKLAEDGLAAGLTATERVGIEALVNIHDRPALRVRNGDVDPNDPLLGDWQATLLLAADKPPVALASVGRIDLDGEHVGTGFVVAPGCIMTNRHVLEAIAEEFRKLDGSTGFAFTGEPSINFADDGLGDARRFRITRVIAAGPDRIDDTVDFAHLDMALLQVETRNSANMDLPAALPMIEDPQIAASKAEIFVAGYPARPPAAAVLDPETNVIRPDVVARLREIFGLAYSVKYLSPGEIDNPAGSLTGDARGWVFAHDATTLGGNSGSWVIRIGEPFGVIGLHFGGGTLRANFAHGIAAVRKTGLIGQLGDELTWI